MLKKAKIKEEHFMDYEKRIIGFQNKIKKSGWDGVFIGRRGALGYFTGAFIPWCSALFIPIEGEPELITQRYDINRVITASYVKKTRGWAPQGDVSYVDCLISLIKERKLQNAVLGFEMETAEVAGVLTAYEYLEVNRAFPNLKIVNAIGEVNDMLVKRDDEEIELLHRAAEAADYSMQCAFDSLYIGMTETELAGVAEYAGRKAGSMFNWSVTGTEIGSGYHQAYENCWTVIPGHKRIQRGDIITLDIHTMYDLYLSDLSLNAVIGKPSKAQKDFSDKWKALCDYLLSLIRPGQKCSVIAKKVIEKGEQLGVGKYLMHSFGHGLGLEVRIPPTVSPENDYILQDKMAMVAIIQLTDPAIGGLRMEMPSMVTSNGPELLCKTPIELYIKDI
jgi:Xaa-Pro dipeptidase